MVQEMPQFPLLDQLIQVLLQVPAVLGDMPRFFVVLAIQDLIALPGISCHLIRPFKEWLILDLFTGSPDVLGLGTQHVLPARQQA